MSIWSRYRRTGSIRSCNRGPKQIREGIDSAAASWYAGNLWTAGWIYHFVQDRAPWRRCSRNQRADRTPDSGSMSSDRHRWIDFRKSPGTDRSSGNRDHCKEAGPVW